MPTITNPTLFVNDNPVKYIPNTIEWKDGDGEVVVRTETTGGGNTENVYVEDITTRKGMVKFELLMNTENDTDTRTWKRNRENNTVKLVFGDWSKVFPKAVIIGDVDKNAGMEGKLTVEFESGTAI